jgi:UDP-glucose 4-epimerase
MRLKGVPVKSKESDCFSNIRRCALFGANGYIGSQLAYLLHQRQVEVALFDVQDQGHLSNKTVYQRFDVCDPACWNDFEPARYDALFFFSGLTGTDRSFTRADDFLAVNEGGALRLCRKLAPLGEKAPKVIFPSTRLIYKGSPVPLSEDAEKETKTLYAVNKWACENMLYAYHTMYGIPYVVTRICVPYGTVFPSEYAYGTIGFFLKQARQGLPICLFGGGVQKRTFTHVADVCHACMQVADRNDLVSGIFNIGGETFALREVARMVAEKFGITIESVEWPDVGRKLESGDTVFDDAKLVKEIGDYRMNDLKNWLAEL